MTFSSAYFGQFEPLTDSAPGYPFSLLPTIVARARRCLTGRTREQIVSAARSIDWFIEEYFRSEQEAVIRRICEHGGWELGYLKEEDRNEEGIRNLLDYWPSWADDPAPDFPTSENTSEVDALRECISSYVLSDDDDFPNGTDSEYFAVLAVRKIADAIRWLRPAENDQFRGVPRDLQQDARAAGFISERLQDFSLAGACAIEAMDAVCEAEQLRTIDLIAHGVDQLRAELLRKNAEIDAMAEVKAKERVSVAASKAAIMRHAENRAMKAQVFEWCDENLIQYRSMDAAAEAIAWKLVPAAFRTVRNWIGEWRKVQSARIA